MLALAGCSFPHGQLTTDSNDTGGGDDAPPMRNDAATDAPRTCPSGFIALPTAPITSQYKAFPGATYAMAIQTCMNMNTHLARLDTQGEADSLYGYIDSQTNLGDTHLYRIVAKRDASVTPNRWLDLDNTTPLTFLPWGTGEPTNNSGEDCALLRTQTATDPTRVIGADQCTTNHEFACECE